MSGRSPRYSYWVRDAMSEFAYDFSVGEGQIVPKVGPTTSLPPWLSYSGPGDVRGLVATSTTSMTEIVDLPAPAVGALPPFVARNPGAERYAESFDLLTSLVDDEGASQQPEWGVPLVAPPTQEVAPWMPKVDDTNWSWDPDFVFVQDYASSEAVIENCPADSSSSDRPIQTITSTASGLIVKRLSAVTQGEYTVSVWARQDPAETQASWRCVGTDTPTTGSTDAGPVFTPTGEWRQYVCQLQSDGYRLQSMSTSENPVFFAYHQISSSVNGTVTVGEPRSVAQSWYDSTTPNPVPNFVVKKEIRSPAGFFDIEWAYRPYYGTLAESASHTLLSYGDEVVWPMVSVQGSSFCLHDAYLSTIAATIEASWAPNDIVRLRASNLDGMWKLTVTVPNSVQQTVSYQVNEGIFTDLCISSMMGENPEQGSDFIGINIIR